MKREEESERGWGKRERERERAGGGGGEEEKGREEERETERERASSPVQKQNTHKDPPLVSYFPQMRSTSQRSPGLLEQSLEWGLSVKTQADGEHFMVKP